MNSVLIKSDTIQNISFKESFEQLSEEEKNYVYYLSKACWAGQPIVLFQTSYESPALFIIFQSFFSSLKEISEVKLTLLKNNISDVNYNNFIKYAAYFYSNFGNYYKKKKFIPNIKIDDFEAILKLSPAFKEIISSIWDIIKYMIYDDSDSVSYINLEEKNGKNGYYFGGIKEEQIKNTDKILRQNNYSLINTRLFKLNTSKVVTLISSIEEKQITLNDEIILFYGEYSSFLKKINDFLEDAKKYTTKEHEKEIINDYISFFNDGDVEKHKESQKKWVKDNSSLIDFNYGFNENIIDPIGVRGLFESFVGIADNFRSQKYEQLVQLLPQLAAEFPWDKNFKKELNSIQFNSIEIISFGRNGCPFGKCLPNYYEVREKHGVKNFLFFNSFPDFNSKENDFFFCDEKDIELINNFGKQAIKILTSIKQLIGYGSGKLLRVQKNENNEEVSNFDRQLINPLTEKVIDKYYIDKETFEERFTTYAPILNEVRALLIGLYFCENKPIEELFYVNKADFKNVTYTIWLTQIFKAFLGLISYNEVNKTWVYFYDQAVWILIKYILESQQEGEEILKINFEEEKETFKIQINKETIFIYGKELISKLMLKFHIWKCIGDVESAKECINHYSEVDEQFLKIKKIIEKNKTSKTLFLFHNLIKDKDGNIIYKEYEENLEGIIESNLDRFGTEYNKDVYNQWVKYVTNFIKS